MCCIRHGFSIKLFIIWNLTIRLTITNANDLGIKPTDVLKEISEGQKSVKFQFHYFSKTNVNFNFFGPCNESIVKDNEVVNNDRKYVFAKSDTFVTIYINDPDIDDFGSYILIANNTKEQVKRVFELRVFGLPKCVTKDTYFEAGFRIVLNCSCKAYPAPQITWILKFCNDVTLWPKCEEMVIIKDNETLNIKESEHVYSSIIKFNSTQPGVMKCRAENDHGVYHTQSRFQIWDIFEPFEITRSDENPVIAGDIFTLECKALIYNFTNKINLLKNYKPIKIRRDIKVFENHTRFSYRKLFKFIGIRLEDIGNYTCEVYDRENKKHEVNAYIEVLEAQPPLITTDLNPNRQPLVGESFSLNCSVSGLPFPKVIWNKDGNFFQIKENDSTRIVLTNNNMTLKFIPLKLDDIGTYECVATNRAGKATRSIKIKFSIFPYIRFCFKTFTYIEIIITFVILTVIIILPFYLKYFMKNKRKKKISYALYGARFKNFKEEDIEYINPDIRIDEQGDLLPYDKSFDFPRSRLELRKQLGSGYFGVVREAIALGILEDGVETLVAVKMAKKKSDSDVIRALISELKISIFIGKHINIVNLLGAVTENISKLELMVIYEYCQFGNLQKFLVKNSQNFINQVRDDQIHLTITKDKYLAEKKNKAGSSRSVNQQSDHNRVVDTLENVIRKFRKTEAKENNYEIEQSTKSSVSFTTFDIISWSQQVAKGMKYLSSKRIVHGDLAARNVLLCDDNVVKICDFGLSKTLSDRSYIRKNDKLLPFKWMSLEAIKSRKFSVQSDIWSFGIVLWEFFSLGDVPYHDMVIGEILFNKIESGYRLDKPKYATTCLYEIMQSCWRVNAELRPLFATLESKFDTLMDIIAKDKYVLIKQESYIESDAIYENQVCSRAHLSVPKIDAPLPLSIFKETDNSEESTCNSQPLIEISKQENFECHQNIEQKASLQDELKEKLKKKNLSI